MRGFLVGLLLITFLTVTILSFRPGGLRRQVRFAARRLRIVLVLGGVFIAGSTIIRLAFPEGPVADYGPSAIAIVLAAVFLWIGRDPIESAGSSPPPRAP